MSILDLYNKNQVEVCISHADLKRSRTEIIAQTKKHSRFDIIVAGGGIQGAAIARLAAFNGLKVLLLEISDYGSGTSGRTSKMAHGGLRYLEYFDFKQVKEGVKAREQLYKTAPHLVHAYPFLIPIKENEKFKRLKMSLGLSFYDLFLKHKDLKHKWLNDQPEISTLLAQDKKITGYFKFHDGIMHDVRLVLENIYAARQEGAVCLNYARIDSVYQNHNDTEVAWTDVLTNEKHVNLSGIVVNTTGAWAPLLGRLTPDNKMPQIRYSQGTHLLFNVKWDKPAILFSLPGKGRNYFVWPHFGGTMVGTTEKELPAPEFNPQPSISEIDEILSRLEKDLPGAGLNRSSLFYAFAGIRTLPSSNSSNQTFKISRRHIWSYSQGILSLLGGKHTSAGWTALEGIKNIFKYANIARNVIPLKDRMFPGAFNCEHEIKIFEEKCKEKEVSQKIIDSCIRRLGARVRILIELDPEFKTLSNEILISDLMYALYFEQAESLEDIFSRRLDLEFTPGNGLDVLAPVSEWLKNEKTEVDWDIQVEKYKRKVENIKILLQ